MCTALVPPCPRQYLQGAPRFRNVCLRFRHQRNWLTLPSSQIHDKHFRQLAQMRVLPCVGQFILGLRASASSDLLRMSLIIQSLMMAAPAKQLGRAVFLCSPAASCFSKSQLPTRGQSSKLLFDANAQFSSNSCEERSSPAGASISVQCKPYGCGFLNNR